MSKTLVSSLISERIEHGRTCAAGGSAVSLAEYIVLSRGSIASSRCLLGARPTSIRPTQVLGSLPAQAISSNVSSFSLFLSLWFEELKRACCLKLNSGCGKFVRPSGRTVSRSASF